MTNQLKDNKITHDYYVVFIDATFQNWFMRRLKPNFQHVYAMKKSEHGNFWIIIQPHRCHLEPKIVPVSMYPHPRAYAGMDAVILPVRAKIDSTRTRGALCVFNCVEVVKALLGIKSFFTFTPWQLYKYLTRARK